ncbi:hypothetical protein [Methyloglobulus sp.]|uniref:hypothetical protein n=1 Tax=Methyloglobulus sp. TaxID=2518622 RepID=UPI0032B8733D
MSYFILVEQLKPLALFSYRYLGYPEEGVKSIRLGNYFIRLFVRQLAGKMQKND